MTISQLIAEIRLSRANAISANVATDPESKIETVAKIATLAVADEQSKPFSEIQNNKSTNQIAVNTGDDPRRYCSQCNNLSRSGQCLAAKLGELHHFARTYRPITDILINCACFLARSVD